MVSLCKSKCSKKIARLRSNRSETTMKNLIKELKSGIFPNDKNRLWTMCQVTLKLATLTAEYAEEKELTDTPFYLDFEDALNCISVKDHDKFKENVESFYKNKES